MTCHSMLSASRTAAGTGGCQPMSAAPGLHSHACEAGHEADSLPDTSGMCAARSSSTARAKAEGLAQRGTGQPQPGGVGIGMEPVRADVQLFRGGQDPGVGRQVPVRRKAVSACMQFQMNVQVGEIEGGLGLGGVVEIQQAERRAAAAGEDLLGRGGLRAPRPVDPVRSGAVFGSRRRPGNQRVALGCGFRDVAVVPQPAVHPPPQIGDFHLRGMDGQGGQRLRGRVGAAHLGGPGELTISPTPVETFIAETCGVLAHIPEGRSGNGAENDDVRGAPQHLGRGEGPGSRRMSVCAQRSAGTTAPPGRKTLMYPALGPDDARMYGR